jgi:hypothetical protein
MPTHSDRLAMSFLKFGRKSQALPQEPRCAPSVGRALRTLLGLAVIVYLTPVYFQVPVRLLMQVLLLMLGLTAAYSLIHIVVSRCIITFWPMQVAQHARCLTSVSLLLWHEGV